MRPILHEGMISAEDFGSKAAHLSQLVAMGMQVPAGMAIQNDEAAAISLEECQEIFDQLNAPLIVRSSSVCEDGDKSSFAGQFESVLHINSANDLHQAIQRCHQQFQSKRSLEYARTRGVDANLLTKGSIVVQEQVDAKWAGVLFSCDPVSGIENHMVIEYTTGVADQLLEGKKSGTLLKMDAFRKRILEGAAPENLAILLKDLVAKSLEIQAKFGIPQDIEWAIDQKDQIFFVQARPITKIQWRHDKGEFSNAYFRDGGVSANVCTTLMASLYESAFQEAMEKYVTGLYLKPKNEEPLWAATFYGRPYWNIGRTKTCLMKIPGFNEQDFDHDIGVNKDYGSSGPRVVPETVQGNLKALPSAAKLFYLYVFHERTTSARIKEFSNQINHFFEKLQSSTLRPEEHRQDFRHVLRSLHHDIETTNFKTSYLQANAQSDFEKLVRKLNEKYELDISIQGLLTDLNTPEHNSFQDDLDHVLFLIHKKGEAKEVFKRFLQTYWYHGDHELDISKPRWIESPQEIYNRFKKIAPLNGAITRESGRSSRPTGSFATYRKDVVRQLKKGSRASRLEIPHFLFLLNTTRKLQALRESFRVLAVKTYSLIRFYALESDQKMELTVSPQQCMFLRFDELSDVLIDGSVRPFESLIEFRKLYYRGWRNADVPNEFGMTTKQGVSDRGITAKLSGIGCSEGRVTGRIRVAESIKDAVHLQQGEILVTKFTDPSWTPYLRIPSAILTEVGGLLSHSAVISREYGIPCVLNIPSVTQTLKTGDLVFVDGRTGQVVLQEVSKQSGKEKTDYSAKETTT